MPRKEGEPNVGIFNKICLLLLILGGVNWGLMGLFTFDAVGWLFGGTASLISRIVFTVIGAAALCAIPGLFAPGPDDAKSDGMA